MAHHRCKFSTQTAALLLTLSLCALAHAQGNLKTINPPQGGKIVYGQVDGQTTEAGAMGAILHSLHERLGDRPQVGKLFQVHGTQSVAAFFSVTRKTQGGGQVAGLIIATKASSDHVEAALVTDDAARFPKTLPSMMKALFAVWRPLQSAGPAEPTAASGNAAPLRQITLQDNSASVGLPEGWNIVPNRSMMGTIVATGPHEESAELGITFLAEDTNNPRVQRLMQSLRNGQLQNTAYARASYVPYGADPEKTLEYLLQGVRQRAGLPKATYDFTSVTAVPGPPAQRCFRMEATADFGNGQRAMDAVYCVSPPNSMSGTWLSEAYMTTAPVEFAARDSATLGAILASFNVNMNVVNAQGARMAAPAIAQIHAIGRAAANQAAAAHQMEDIHNSSVYQHWDSMDKRSQEFENYQLGYSVISDNQGNAHGTFWNEDADALVKSNPERYEYVSAPDYWKSIDY